MVSVREVHQHVDERYALEQFDFEKWASELLHFSDASALGRFRIVWEFCFENSAGSNRQSVCFHNAIEIIEILSTLNMDVASVCAALLFPFLEAKIICFDDLKSHLDKDVIQLASDVVGMKGIGQLRAVHNRHATAEQIDSIRRMLLAMVTDFRSVIIKLAERIMFLRDMLGANEEERVLAAKECVNIYAPLANRLGIGQLKWELEDLCFRYLHPRQYRQIAVALNEKRTDRERYIEKFIEHLKQLMGANSIKSEIYGRPKHIYSIWRKIEKKGIPFDLVYDIRAIRVITSHVDDCYTVLSIIHANYKHIAVEFDDYIANPKQNGYQSIHTVIFGIDKKVIEVQIRTWQMHNDAELGVPAHWKYKEGSTDKLTPYDRRIVWLRKLVAWQEEMSGSGEIGEDIRQRVFNDRVYVFTPQGDVVDLPAGSTPLDFAYHIHSDVGHRCVGAKVGNRIVPFTYKLQMGDQVEIITQKEPNPSPDWLNQNQGFVQSSRARAKIQAWFKRQNRDKNILLGRQMVEGALSTLNLGLKEVEGLLITRYKARSFDEILASVGSGDIRIKQLVNFVTAELHKPTTEQQDETALKQLSQKAEAMSQHGQKMNGQIIIHGIGNLMYNMAGCCRPIPGDKITGFITQSRGVSIHRARCEQLMELKNHAAERVVEATWGENQSGCYRLVIRVVAHDRNGLLRDITSILTNEKVNLFGISLRSDNRQHIAFVDIDMAMPNCQIFNRVLSKINKLPEVIEAKRFSS